MDVGLTGARVIIDRVFQQLLKTIENCRFKQFSIHVLTRHDKHSSLDTTD
jgi:hypothetical protein